MSVIFPLLMYCCINLSSSKSFINKTMSVQDFQPISSWKEQGEAAGFTLYLKSPCRHIRQLAICFHMLEGGV